MICILIDVDQSNQLLYQLQNVVMNNGVVFHHRNRENLKKTTSTEMPVSMRNGYGWV